MAWQVRFSYNIAHLLKVFFVIENFRQISLNERRISHIVAWQ